MTVVRLQMSLPPSSTNTRGCVADVYDRAGLRREIVFRRVGHLGTRGGRGLTASDLRVELDVTVHDAGHGRARAVEEKILRLFTAAVAEEVEQAGVARARGVVARHDAVAGALDAAHRRHRACRPVPLNAIVIV